MSNPTSLNLNMGTSTTVILNSDMQYVQSSVATLKKWVDTDSVISVRKNKTIYVLKAVNDWEAAASVRKAVFYGTDGLEQWAGFATADNRPTALNVQNVNNNIYGNINANLSGISGSLTNDFAYVSTGRLTGNVNVSANLSNYNGANLSTGLPISLNGIRVDTRTANVNLLMANVASQSYEWNRLINANIASSVLVNASTDPCDITGTAISLPMQIGANASTNELYRHQFSVKSNLNATGINSENPTYMVRLERFGRNTTVNSNVLLGNFFIGQFTDAFYTNIANIACDNIVYANSLTNLKNIEITGNLAGNSVTTINGNFVANPLLSDSNTNLVPSQFDSQYGVSLSTVNSNIDSIQANLRAGQTLLQNERITFLQANITNASNGLFLQGNVKLNNGNSVLLNNTLYTYKNPNDHFVANTDSTQMTEFNPKVVSIFGSSLSTSAGWVTSNVYNNLAVPVPSGISSSGNNEQDLDIYVVKGGVTLENFITNSGSTNIEGNPFLSSVPSYIGNVVFNNGNISFNDSTNGTGITANGDLTLYSGSVTRNFTLNGQVVSLSSNIAPEYHVFLFGNTQENQRANVANVSVVTNQRSYVAKAWGDSMSPSVRIVYDNTLSSALSVNSELAKSLPEYNLKLINWVGKADVPSGVQFSPNISIHGNVNPTSANILSDYTNLLPVLDNNRHLSNLCLNGVLYTDYNVDKSMGGKWTEQGNICSLDNTNYTYKAVLPQYGNLIGNLTNANSLGLNINDTFINTLVSYGISGNIVAEDVHKLTLHDLQYKAYVEAVKRPGTSDLTNTMTAFGNSTSANPINSDIYINNSYNSQIKGNISAQPFLTFCYSGMTDTSPAETMYPFFKAGDTAALNARNITSNVDLKKYLFPGFTYNTSNEFFGYRNAADCDFQINTDSFPESNRNFRIYAVDPDNSTVKISLDSGVVKTLPLRPIKLGNRTFVDTVNNTAMNWYSYATVFLTNSSGSRDYMVLLFQLKSNNSDRDAVPADVPEEVKNFLPVTVIVKPVSKWNENKVKFTVAHRAYTSAGVAKPEYNSSSDYSGVVDLNTFYTPVNTNSTNSVVSVNVFSQPVNNLLVTMQYKGSTIKNLITYSRADYNLNSNLIIGSNQEGVFGVTNVNNTSSLTADVNNSALLNLAPYSTRYYLDGFNSGVYFDKANTTELVNNVVLRVYRSASYELYRNNVIVGNGLLSRNSSNNAASLVDTITENLATTKSGFNLTLTHNLVNLCSRLHLQSINTVPSQNVAPEFSIKTLPDKLNLNVASYDAVNKVYIRVEKVARDLLANSDINLTTLFRGSLPNIKLSSVRGYAYSLDLTNGGEASTNSTLVTVTQSNIFKSAFRLILAPDNYTIFNANTGRVLNGANKCVFTSSLSPSTNVANDFILSYDNRTISSNLVSLPANTNIRLETIRNSGIGQVSYIVEDFIGHYNTSSSLEEYAVPISAANTNQLSKNLNHTLNTQSAVRTVSLKTNSGSYYFDIDLGNSEEKYTISFLGAAYPQSFAGAVSSILYTGRRAIVLHSTVSAANGKTYDDIKNSVWHFNTARDVFVGQAAAALKNSANVSAQSYAVVLLNSARIAVSDVVNFRSMGLNIKLPAITNRTLSWATIYMNGTTLNDLLLRCTFGNNQTRSLALTSDFNTNKFIDFQRSDNDIQNGKSASLTTYDIKQNGVQYFRLSVKDSLPVVNNFVYTINPCKAHFYEAYDQNNNNIIDTTRAQNSVLTANFLSDVVYNITSSAAMTNNIEPKFSVDMNNIIDFNSGWISLLGTNLELKFNNKFSVGYALDCYFVIKNNTSAEFEVFEISANANKANENLDTAVFPNSLTAIKRRKLRISNKDYWATANGLSNESLPGMSFKLANNAVVKTGDIVNVFTSNEYNPENKLTWNVTNLENNTSKTIQLDYFDEERYAVLLNNQLIVQ
jgi:hypothetical protein